MPSGDAWAVEWSRAGRGRRSADWSDFGKCRPWRSNRRRLWCAPRRRPARHGTQFRVLLLKSAVRLAADLGKGREMNPRLISALLVLWLAACATQPQPTQTSAAPPPAAAPAAPNPPPSPSEAQIAPGRWDVDRVRCSDLLGAADDDRAAAAMFYYGYLAAKAGIHVIDVGKIDENVGKVMKQCAATPNLTVPQAFRQALRPRRSTS